MYLCATVMALSLRLAACEHYEFAKISIGFQPFIYIHFKRL